MPVKVIFVCCSHCKLLKFALLQGEIIMEKGNAWTIFNFLLKSKLDTKHLRTTENLI